MYNFKSGKQGQFCRLIAAREHCGRPKKKGRLLHLRGRLEILLVRRLAARLLASSRASIDDVVVTLAFFHNFAMDQVADEAAKGSTAKQYDDEVKVERDEAKSIFWSIARENIPQVEELQWHEESKGEDGVKLMLKSRHQVLGHLAHQCIVALRIDLAGEGDSQRVLLNGFTNVGHGCE